MKILFYFFIETPKFIVFLCTIFTYLITPSLPTYQVRQRLTHMQFDPINKFCCIGKH